MMRDTEITTPPHGNSKVTRGDWLRAARDTLVSEGVDSVKILRLSKELGVARSSFYGYFNDRGEVLDALLADWETRNTKCILDKCAEVSQTINHAVCHFFECFIDPDLFDQGLDFAVREWARRDEVVRTKIDAADTRRIDAVRGIFARHGYPPEEADARARILYFMQLGYHALEIKEPLDLRLSRVPGYLKGFTGQTPSPAQMAAFVSRTKGLLNKPWIKPEDTAK